jgi:hypothetical protein
MKTKIEFFLVEVKTEMEWRFLAEQMVVLHGQSSKPICDLVILNYQGNPPLLPPLH